MQFSALAMGIASLVGTGVAVAGQVMQGQAQAAQGRQMQAQENLNAMISDQNAKAIRQSGQFEADKQRRENIRLLGRQRALTAKSGVRFSGSPLDLMSDTIAEQELDLAALNFNTDIAARRATSQADYSRFLGSNYNEMGKIAGNESLFKAGTTLLTSGSEWANKYAGAFKFKAPTKVSTSTVK